VFDAAEGAESAGVEFDGFDGLGEFKFGHGDSLHVGPNLQRRPDWYQTLLNMRDKLIDRFHPVVAIANELKKR